MDRISFIGVNALASPMLLRLLDAGFQITVHNKTKYQAEEALEKGAVWADTIEEGVKDAALILSAVTYADEAEELYFGEGGILETAPEGCTIIDMTTKSPELASRISEAAEGRNIRAVEAPLMGGTTDAANGTLTFMLGGDEETCRSITPVLEHLGSRITYVGDSAAAQQMKMALQIATAGILSGLSESMAYSGNVQLDRNTLFSLMADELGTTRDTVLSLENKPDVAPGSELTVRHMLADFQTAREDAAARHLNLSVLNTVTNVYSDMNREGYGHAGTNFLVAYYNSFTRNGTILQYFEWYLPSDGTLWKQLAENAPLLESMGFTAVWTPPAYKAMNGTEDVGYGVYDVYDLGEFDQKGTVRTKYGTKDEYQAAIHACHEAGLHVYPDIVLNHKLGADATEDVEAVRVSPDNRNYELDLEYHVAKAETVYNFEGRGGQYSDFTWDHRYFSGVRKENPPGSPILKLKGHEWSKEVDNEFGNFDYLMGADLDLENPRVYEQLVKWGSWFIRETGVDGLRLDAIKHMSRSFYLKWLADMRREAGRELFCVGEYWSADMGALTYYLGEEKAMSLFDVPLHFKFFHASYDQQRIDFQHILCDTLVEQDPVHAVTFVDNHDTQPNQALESTVGAWFKPVAYALILLREAGYPCVFFADLSGLPTDRLPAVAELPLLLEIRRRFSYGAQIDFFDEPDLVAWARLGDEHEQSGCVVVLSSRPEEESDGPVAKTIELGPEHAGERWCCVLGKDSGFVEVGKDGKATFTVGNAMLSVFLRVDAARTLDNIPINI